MFFFSRYSLGLKAQKFMMNAKSLTNISSRDMLFKY